MDSAKARGHLAELISTARRAKYADEQTKSKAFDRFMAALDALQAVGAISKNDSTEWVDRMMVALGGEPLEPPELLPDIGTSTVTAPSSKSRFVALVPVTEPEGVLDHGGRVQILGVELFSDKVNINWRLSPEPDYELVFVAELAALEPDLDGLPTFQQQQRRNQLLHRLQMQGRFIGLSDDLGTEYRSIRGGSSGASGEKSGHSEFVPGVPTAASRLTILWDDAASSSPLEFSVELPSDRS
jgi:hypothetical protein